MEKTQELKDSIDQYQFQLVQVNAAINSAQEGDDRDNLISLKNDIEELLRLTRENLDSISGTARTSAEKTCDPFADEYALFKAELADLGEISGDQVVSNEENNKINLDESNVEEEIEDGLQNDLNALVGTKCQAPYRNKSGVSGFHNALISTLEIRDSISDLDHIEVRVLFTNPTEKEMVPCPYFLDNKCRFGEKCNFSHGHLVKFSVLKEYKEPDFSLVKAGSRVLAKLGDHLWQSAVVEDVTSHESCTLKHEGRYIEVPLDHILPLSSSNSDSEGDSDLSDLDEEEKAYLMEQYELQTNSFDNSAFIEASLMRQPASTKLGDWEKHTKGIGSKLMAKMGYIVGTGLGKSGEGRLDPVEATILPAGKSLDHCMSLKEAAGGSKDLFSAERIQKKLAMQELRKSQRRYRREKQQEKHNVFNVINKLSSGAGPSVSGPKRKIRELKKKLATTTGRELNVERLKAAEDIRHTERNIYILQESLTRQKAGTIPHKNILAKLQSAQGHLLALQNFDDKVAREQNFRVTKKKMTEF